MQTINVRALIFKRDLVAVNMSVTGIMLVKLFGDLIFETWAPGQIASESMTSFFCWSVLISSFNHNSSNTMPILTNTYTLTQSFAECKTRLIKKLQPGDEKNFKCTFRLQSQVRWNYSHRFDAWSYNLCGIYFRSCIRPHSCTRIRAPGQVSWKTHAKSAEKCFGKLRIGPRFRPSVRGLMLHDMLVSCDWGAYIQYVTSSHIYTPRFLKNTVSGEIIVTPLLATSTWKWWFS